MPDVWSPDIWSTAPVLLPLAADTDTDVEEEVTEETRLDNPWRVILYNDEVHTFDEVTFQLMKALGCTLEHAEALTWKAHSEGKASVFEGSFEECFRVQAILREIALITEIEG